jgi:putative ABC transport system permease protein
VLSEGAVIAAIGTLAGSLFGFAVAQHAVSRVEHLHLDTVLPLLAAALVLIAGAVVASLIPAARASRVDVLQALRSE